MERAALDIGVAASQCACMRCWAAGSAASCSGGQLPWKPEASVVSLPLCLAVS